MSLIIESIFRSEELFQSGNMKFAKIGGLRNNAGAGVTGKIQLLTQGYTAGTLNFSVVLTLIKMYA
jgi:hypothetical protein